MATYNEMFNYKEWVVVGILKNEGNVVSTDTNIMAVLYNSKGIVVGVAGLYLFDSQPGDIPIGGEATFEIEASLLPEYQTVTSTSLYVESNEAVGGGEV